MPQLISECSHIHAVHSTFLSFLSHGQCKLCNCPLPFSLQAWGDVMAPGADESGEVRLIANPATLQRLPWHRQHAIALADLVWKPLPDKELRAADGELPAGAPLRTRLTLQRMVGPDNLARPSVYPCGISRQAECRARGGDVPACNAISRSCCLLPCTGAAAHATHCNAPRLAWQLSMPRSYPCRALVAQHAAMLCCSGG